MNTFRDKIRQMVESPSDKPYLSLYLPVNGDIPLETMLNSLISEYKSTDTSAARSLENLKRHVKDFTKFTKGQTLAAFGPEGKIETQFILQEKCSPFLALGNKPYIAPLKNHLNKKNSYLVILLERERAQIYSYQFDQLALVHQLEGAVPQKVKRGSGNWMGFRSDPNEHRIDRHTQWHLREFFKHVGEYAYNLFNRGMAFHNYDHVILGTHTQLATPAKQAFPSFISERVVSEFNVDLDEKNGALKAKIEGARQDHEKRQEESLLNLIDNNKNTDGIAAVGLEQVRQQLELGTVSDLVINNDYTDLKPAEFNDLLSKALSLDADVHVIKHQQNNLPDGIAAKLRFRAV